MISVAGDILGVCKHVIPWGPTPFMEVPAKLLSFEKLVSDGPLKGEVVDKEKFDKMLHEYYALRGLDEDGIPTEETFKRFGLSSEWKVFKKRLGKDEISHG